MALRSGFHRSRLWRRKLVNTLRFNGGPSFFSRSIGSWLNEPIKPMQRKFQAPIPTPPQPAAPSEFLPEVLGVILEVKREDSVS